MCIFLVRSDHKLSNTARKAGSYKNSQTGIFLVGFNTKFLNLAKVARFDKEPNDPAKVHQLEIRNR